MAVYFIRDTELDECIGCGSCADICPVDAVTMLDDRPRVDENWCIGCGVCTVTCPEGALSLVERPEAERTKPPVNTMDWMTQRAMGRGVDPSELL